MSYTPPVPLVPGSREAELLEVALALYEPLLESVQGTHVEDESAHGYCSGCYRVMETADFDHDPGHDRGCPVVAALPLIKQFEAVRRRFP